MPRYRVQSLEKFVVRCTYHVEAANPAVAEQLCRSGEVAYDTSTMEGDEEWLSAANSFAKEKLPEAPT
jgi:hypothetical protein